MWKYIIRRIILMIPVLLGVTFLIFTLMYITPGDPARQMLGPYAEEADVQALRNEMGLNDPFLVRFGRYLKGLVFHLDFGKSYMSGQSVTKELLDRFPTTILLTLLAAVVSSIIGISLGIVSAVKQYSWIDYLTRSFAIFGISMPSFWLGMMLILLFSINLKWLPSSGFYGPSYWVLPACTLGIITSASIMRMTRSSMLEVLRQDYIRTARAKGQTENKIITRHALKNALIPIITTIGISIGRNLGGAVVVESVFSVPGIGKQMVDAISDRNYELVQGGVMLIAFAYGIVNLIVDILYAYVDPRVKSRYKGRKKKKAGQEV